MTCGSTIIPFNSAIMRFNACKRRERKNKKKHLNEFYMFVRIVWALRPGDGGGDKCESTLYVFSCFPQYLLSILLQKIKQTIRQKIWLNTHTQKASARIVSETFSRSVLPMRAHNNWDSVFGSFIIGRFFGYSRAIVVDSNCGYPIHQNR